MAGAVRTDAYLALLRALVRFRAEAGLSQAELAVRLNKPPSFVAKFELGERRLDVVELLVILRVFEIEPSELLPALQDQLPERL
jgi:transcriptional regulator with XRE-family HTH domain